MSTAWQFYTITLLVYFGTNAIACWALNLQYGVAGIMNFAFILFQAAGAYTAAVLTLGSSSLLGFQHYVLGMTLPWPIPLLAAGAVGCALSLVIGFIALRPRRSDYQAVLMLITSIIATVIVSTETGFLNGEQGLAAIPKPFASLIGSGEITYGWFYVALTAGVALCCYFVVHRITSSPWGRLRAMRDNPNAASALSTNVVRERLTVYAIGGGLAALSGAVLVQFISAWAPSGWTYPETFLFFAAIIVGGLGNNAGATLGAAIVLGGILEAVEFIPSFGVAGVAEAAQWIVLGLLVIAFLWFRPKGLIPERRRHLNPGRSPDREPACSAGARPDERQRHAAPPADPFLSVDSLRRTFGGVAAVDGTSFQVAQGRITALIGPNGAGKSTVLNLIAGALKPTAGSVMFGHEDIAGQPAHRIARRGIIRTFQLLGEFERLTVLENLLVGARGRGNSLGGALLGKRYWRRSQEEQVERAVALLTRFDLLAIEDEYAGNLSGGQKRMVEIMRAMMSDPTLMLLDEPFAGVSRALSGRVEEHLTALREEGLTVLMVEHELGAVDRLSDAVVVMVQGRVLAEGSMADLRRNKEVIDAYLVG